jgi:pimeloyl-ACP methyl ester carboxylesterase/DNA-binding CsgD family transcriptional regulator
VRPAIRFCRSRDGVRIAFATAGSGPPLVQTPTWLTHLELDWSSVVWGSWLEELTRDRTLVRYDLRGCGLSDRSVNPLRLDRWVDDLEAVAGALGLERFPLLGLCQGATIAAAFAARHPDRVTRLVLYGGYVQGAFVRDPGSEVAREATMLGHLIETGWGRPTPAFREIFACMLMPDAPPNVARALAETERECADPVMAARLWTAFHRVDVKESAGRIRAPTIVLHARGDGMVPFAEGRRLATLIPGARFIPLESNNHILQAGEGAWIRFWQEVHEFLACDAVPSASAERAFPDLTSREREVLDKIARGLSNASIAETLAITPKTVRNHVTNIFGKLAVSHRSEAIVLAREAGFGRSG